MLMALKIGAACRPCSIETAPYERGHSLESAHEGRVFLEVQVEATGRRLRTHPSEDIPLEFRKPGQD